jgi:hypothetical protein
MTSSLKDTHVHVGFTEVNQSDLDDRLAEKLSFINK